jgi:hypothetical protein
VRPGLLVIGVVLLLLAGGTLWGVYYAAPPVSGSHNTTSVSPQLVGPASGGSTSLFGDSQTAGRLSLTWASTVPLSVDLLTGCTPSGSQQCTTRLSHWVGTQAGSFNESGLLGYPLTLRWANNGSEAGTFQATATQSTTSSTEIPVLTQVLVDVSAGALIALGGVAVFLALFLRGNVYGESPPPVSRSADDAAMIAAPPRDTKPSNRKP